MASMSLEADHGPYALCAKRIALGEKKTNKYS